MVECWSLHCSSFSYAVIISSLVVVCFESGLGPECLGLHSRCPEILVRTDECDVRFLSQNLLAYAVAPAAPAKGGPLLRASRTIYGTWGIPVGMPAPRMFPAAAALSTVDSTSGV